MSDDVINGNINVVDKVLLNVKPLSFYFSIIFHLTLLILIIFFYPENSIRRESLTEVSLQNAAGQSQESIIANQVQKEVIRKVVTNSRKTSKSDKSNQKKSNSPEANKKQSVESANTSANNANQTGNTKTINGNSGSGANGNNNVVSADYYYVAVDQMPYPVGGMQSILSKLNIQESKKPISSIYVLAFIDEYGVVQKCLLVKGSGNNTDQLALNIIRKTKFQPGVLNGKRVKVQLYISIPVH